MLAFDRPVSTAEFSFFDDANPRQIHTLPTALRPMMQGGMAEVSLLLFETPTGRTSGMFQARLRPEAEAKGDLASAIAARALITPRAPGLPERLSGWHAVHPDADGAFLVTIHLDGRDALLMRELALDATSVLDLTVELDFAGVSAGLASIAHLPGVELLNSLNSLLPETFDAVEFETAILSLPDHMVSFTATEGAAAQNRDLLLRETASRAIPILLDPIKSDSVEPAYRLIDQDRAGPVSIPLNRPRTTTRTHRVSWAISQFVTSLDPIARDEAFPLLRNIRPFEDVEIRVFNGVPLAATQAMSASIDVTCPGPGGTPENHRIKLRPSDPVTQSIKTRYPALVQPFEVTSRSSVLLHPGPSGGFPRRWPRTPEFQDADDPLLLRLTPKTLNLAAIRLVGESSLFETCARMNVTFTHDGGETQVVLDAEHPDTWVILPGHETGASYKLRIEAVAPAELSGEPVLLRDGPEAANTIFISQLELVLRAPDQVSSQIAAPDIHFAVLELAQPAASQPIRAVLRPGETKQLPVWRVTPFHPLSFDWRASVVRRNANGKTQVMEHLDWVPGGADNIFIH